MPDLQQIKQVLESSAGSELRNYLLLKLSELKDISNIKEYQTTAAQSLEIKAQLRAYNKLKEILSDIMIFSSDTKVKDPRDDFNVY